MGYTFWGVYALARKAALGNPHAVCVGGRRRPRKFCGFVSSIRLQSQDGLQMVAALSNGWPPPADRSAPPPPAAAGGVCHAVAGAVAATAPTSPALGAEKIAGAAAANLAAEPPLAGRQHVGALAPPLAVDRTPVVPGAARATPPGPTADGGARAERSLDRGFQRLVPHRPTARGSSR